MDCQRGQETLSREPCYHCGRKNHRVRDCWSKNGLCIKCRASDHFLMDCPNRQKTITTGPTGNNSVAAGPSRRADTGKGIMRGKAFTLAHIHCIVSDWDSSDSLNYLK
ncbi:zf-CCHC domain-containing protein/Defensin_3 domain-containing protein [Cephalotus follicularis]|uniref:Zf-CCHC domain-containing protein/Defensin_3 domain-containing protein n=1 Tax=Cephalotus follicularis TaxID=3775 RepID=A0A1Q3BM19_CEPFO|nr:zf-CCHC domain-containing protein/Defensin_3 domain-containing protein [Cephalotus follicularis]